MSMRRIGVSADALLKSLGEEARAGVLAELNKGGKSGIITVEDVQSMLDSISSQSIKTVVKRASSFQAPARDFEPQIEIDHKRDVTGKSRTTGTIDDFIKHFQNRFRRISGLFPFQTAGYTHSTMDEVQKDSMAGQKLSVHAMVNDKIVTKSGNIMIIGEDLTGFGRIIISKTNEKAFDKAAHIIKDDIICFNGQVKNKFFIVDEFEFPDVQRRESITMSERDLAIAYISDMHFGSKKFNGEAFNRFVRWLNGEEKIEGQSNELAGKVKYVVVAGDIADGIGIYPNQEKDLEIQDIYQQYRMFDDFVSSIPDYIEVIAIPGNHDAVRRGEPMPAIPQDLITCDCHRLGNPTFCKLEGISHLLYHGTSFDSIIASVPKLNYREPQKVMVELLKRRHLSPLYGRNPIVPEAIDYLVIDTEPEIFQTGHVHMNGIGKYRGALLLNSGTFQDLTDYQVKQGHVPTPGQVYVYEAKLGKINRVDFI
jgi:DNA polymerase II small subunit